MPGTAHDGAGDPHDTCGRDRDQRSRPRAGARAVVISVAVAALVVGGAAFAMRDDGPPRAGNALMDAQQQAELGRRADQQVLGGERVPGQPTIQRLRHDDVTFTVTIAPARPGPNLVRVDVAGKNHDHSPGTYGGTLLVGTPAQDDADELVEAAPRPGTDGLWATVDLPEGEAAIVVSHGPKHRVPFAVATGTETLSADEADLWSGETGPECLSAATAAVLAGGEAGSTCPASGLDDGDAASLETGIAILLDRGVEQIALAEDDSARSQEAAALVRGLADDAGVEVVDPASEPAERSALVVVSGWAPAAEGLASTTALPPDEQPMRTDGTWLAPWLLTPAVVDSTTGAVLPLDFDIRDEEAKDYGQALAEYLPGQAPTASGFAAWRAASDQPADEVHLYAAARTAVMPKSAGGAHHQTEVAWFPGGTVTPVS